MASFNNVVRSLMEVFLNRLSQPSTAVLSIVLSPVELHCQSNSDLYVPNNKTAVTDKTVKMTMIFKLIEITLLFNCSRHGKITVKGQ